MSTPEPDISFIIPVFNEEFNIKGVFRDLYAVLKENSHWKYEVIVIEDGSSDNTLKVIQELVQVYPGTKLIIHEQNKGYNQSMRDGMAKARGRYFMYVGADEEFDCSEIATFVDPLLSEGEDHADLVLGVRWQRNAYKLHRFFLSVIYIFMLNWMFKMRINDYNWSQAWSREFIDGIEIESKSLFMLPEMIIKAHDLGYKIKEVPSNHRGRRTGRSSLNFKIMSKALVDAFKFKAQRKSSKYQPGKQKQTQVSSSSSV